MRPAPNVIAEKFRVIGPQGSNSGGFVAKCGNARLQMIVSDGNGWDHVSVSLKTRTPTWKEMCWAKDLWFMPEEVVMQLHPPKSTYVNFHEYCLHMWRPQTNEEIAVIRAEWGDEWCFRGIESPGVIPLPPAEMVGPKKG